MEDLPVEFTLMSSHQELPAHIGTARELISRNLSRLQAESIVKLDGKSVIIPDLEVLRAELRRPQQPTLGTSFRRPFVPRLGSNLRQP